MDPLSLTVTAASLLFGFLFAGFWWALDRELKFGPDERHFKYAYVLLFVTMGIVAMFGILRPLHAMAIRDASLSGAYGALVASFVGVFGYMLTELGHYSIFQRPKYSTPTERALFWLTVVGMAAAWAWATM
jgi:hypothetical protein